MAGAGRPFAAGPDPRRNTTIPPPRRRPGRRSLLELARDERPATVAALAKLRDDSVALVGVAAKEGLCPKGLGEVARVGLEAAQLLARYSDGEPGAHNVPSEAESNAGEAEAIAEALRGLAQELPPAVEGALDETARRGGDAGGPGDGNGGAA